MFLDNLFKNCIKIKYNQEICYGKYLIFTIGIIIDLQKNWTEL